tara:strand:- start:1603 stop:1977 length:375 start_codon:yes stop_codon:yes gene_type:complete
MRHRKPRKFRYHSNGRNHHYRPNGRDQSKIGPSSFSTERPRSGFKSQQSAQKLVERYNVLAKEALSSGDKILSENYLQHADHFSRIIENNNQKQNITQSVVKNNTQENISEKKEVPQNEVNEKK